MPDKTDTQVFLSYSSEDRKIARSISEELQKHGAKVKSHEYELMRGDSIVERLNDAIASSDYVVVLLSPNSVRSKWVQAEVASFYAAELSSRDVTILPVLVADCDIPPLFASRVFIDLRDNPREAMATLIRRLNLTPRIEFSTLTARRFEELVADLLRETGCSNIHVGRQAEEHGVDIVASYSSKDAFGNEREETWLVEVKLYKHERADLHALRELTARVLALPQQFHAALVTNGHITSAARDWLQNVERRGRPGLRVVEGTELRRLLLKYPKVTNKYFPYDKE